MAGCAGQSSVKPVEALDERTGMTVGALKKPIELVPGAQNVVLSRKRTTFAYLGPVEWNRSGTLSYGLWMHIAPGNDRQLGDIHGSAALTLILDDGPLALTATIAPAVGRSPYRQVASWGQTAYFDLDVESCGAWRRAAGSSSMSARWTVRPDLLPTVDTRAVLTDTCKLAVLLTIDGCDARQRNRGSGPHVAEIHVGVVLRHQPDRQVGVLLRDHPQRIAALHRVVVGAGDAMGGEILLL